MQPFSKSYKLKAQADGRRSELLAALRKREQFDTETGLLASEVQAAQTPTWFAHARQYVAMKWPNASAKHRASIADVGLHSAFMDEGLVALITAGVGLIGGISGAAIGGLAAVRGTRLGAETTARATARQVHDQGSINHEHWLRGQRLESCRALLAAYDSYAIAASDISRALEAENQPSREMWSAIGQAVSDIRNSYFQVRLLVSEDLLQPSRALRLHVEEHKESLDRWADAFLTGDGHRAAAEQAEEDRRCQQLGDLHGHLVEAARRAIAERPATN